VKRDVNCLGKVKKATGRIERRRIALEQQDICAVYYRSSRTLYCNIGSSDNSNIVKMVNDVS